MVPAGIWGLVPPMPKRADFPDLWGLLPNWPWEGQASGEGWEVAALNRPEQGKARYQGWPCWHRAEKGWGIYWSFIRGEKEQPASSRLRRVGETVQATQPSHPSRLVLGSLKAQLGQEEMGNSATVES